MGEFLLLGPVSKDTIIRRNQKTHSVGGAVYYQSKVLNGLGLNYKAAVTLSVKDKDILNRFPDKNSILPIFKEDTVKFENNYYDENPNHRFQRSNAPRIPITKEDISNIFSKMGGKCNGILLGPLLPSDIPLETVLELSKKNIHLYLGLQGYLRQFDGCEISLEPLIEIKKLLNLVDILFLDEKEARAVGNPDDNLSEIARKLSLNGPQEVIITCGSRGSIIYSGEKRTAFKIMPYAPIKLNDPTGLGDTYMAAYISRKLMSNDPQDCGKFASMVASIKLESSEGFDKNWQYIEKRFIKY
ncbi:MAG: PfkB family carbohydrate kinase [Methanobacteriaceae archaeon]|nr:PfkB family carbohydrate kinase [Methanobacteriaceae archaeon]